ncbi:MAG: FOG: PAS/PAC domain [uncultured Lysobacter sp.]|uniref:FOG: PAS/PAC domain n=1 Tax=uncultured Lysobacter sp. TaxID=271060 RepID=A0A6J4L8H4_9GAMM|nr:MAG: FOG: PAS/PAC domain [uncultured Lysobacter sp.]
MQFGKDAVLRLMVVDDSVEAAESIISTLRNQGVAVRPSRPESEEEFGALISGQPLDIVVASRHARSVPVEQVFQRVSASAKDLPVLLLLDSVNDEAFIEAQDLGARNVVLRDRLEHTVGVIRTEWTDLEARRALRRLEAQVRETERRCDSLIESSRDPIAYVHEGMHIRANSAYLEIFGYESFEDVEGMSLLDMIAPGHVDAFKQLLKQLSKGDAPPPRYDVEARALDGHSFPAVMEFSPATYEGEHCLQLVLRRQELDPELAREVEELRQRDQVTGLFNRPTFLRALEDTVSDAAQNATHHGLLLIEPDHYAKLLNEIGLDAADEFAASFAQRLRSAVGPDDIVARFGEHQFAVLSRNSDHVTTTHRAEAVRGAFADHMLETSSRSLNLTVSIGGVQIGEKIASVTAVLAKASQGLQQMIGVGGNRVELFDPGAMDRAEEERIEAWVQRIREALDSDRFVMHYQPLVSLQGDPDEMYEAYLRLRGDQGETVAPMSFLQIAEEHGLLWEIDRWIVAQAINVIGQRLRAGRRTTMLVKITQGSLQDDSLIRHIEEQLARHGADGTLLVLQLPESKVFTHLRQTQEFLSQLSRSGVRLGLEQFGAGLNSFQLLSHIDAAFLKVDRSFTESLPTSPDQQKKLKEITQKAGALGKHTVVDFVRDASTMSVLFSAGVSYAQGFFLAPAGPEMDYEF